MSKILQGLRDNLEKARNSSDFKNYERNWDKMGVVHYVTAHLASKLFETKDIKNNSPRKAALEVYHEIYNMVESYEFYDPFIEGVSNEYIEKCFYDALHLSDSHTDNKYLVIRFIEDLIEEYRNENKVQNN